MGKEKLMLPVLTSKTYRKKGNENKLPHFETKYSLVGPRLLGVWTTDAIFFNHSGSLDESCSLFVSYVHLITRAWIVEH